MWKAMLYKEWIKTRWYLLAAFAVLGGFAGYALVKLHRAAALMGAGHVWEVMVTRNAVFIDQMEYVPLLVGLLLSAVQFVPEMQRRCLKLTLHLPVPALATLTAMIGCGTAALLLLFGLGILLLAAGASPVLPHELVWNILSTALPWCLAGVAAYLFGAWTILEPTWKRRLVNILMSVLLLRIYFLAPGPRAYGDFLPVLALLTLATAALSWLSVVRFMAGRQD